MTPRRQRTARPRRRLASATLRIAVCAGLVGGCGALEELVPRDPAPASASAGTAGPAPTPDAAVPGTPTVPSADTVRSTGTAVQVGATTVLHVLPVEPTAGVQLEAHDSATVLALDPGVGAAVDVLLAAPAGAGVVPQDDASFLVLGADGTLLGGGGRPLTGPGAAPARLTPEADGAVRLTGSGPLTVEVGAEALLGADWGEREGGRSLAVTPSPWARTAGQAGELATWTELVRAVPEADTPTMHDQLTCHALGAPDKDTWNLEPWRPDIGLLRTMAAACNAE